MIATCTDIRSIFGHFFPFNICYDSMYPSTFYCHIQKTISIEIPIRLRIYCQTIDILSWFRHDKHRTENTSKIPIISTAFCQINPCIRTFLAYSYFKYILFFRSEEYPVTHIINKAVKSSLMHGASFTTIYLYLRISHRAFKYQLYLFTIPFGRQLKFIFIQTLFISYSFRKSLTIEFHTILISTESLQLPTRRYSDFRPFSGIITTGTHEIPLYHIITATS